MYHRTVKAIRLGSGHKTRYENKSSLGNGGAYIFKNLSCLKYITLSKLSGLIGAGGSFANCNSLTCLIYPYGQADTFNGASDNAAIKWISIPNTITLANIGYYFRNNRNLFRLSTPQSATDFGTAAFNATGIVKLIIPENVTNITGQFYVDSAKVILCTPTTPPTLQTSNSTIAPDCIIYVPYSADHSILTAYQ